MRRLLLECRDQFDIHFIAGGLQQGQYEMERDIIMQNQRAEKEWRDVGGDCGAQERMLWCVQAHRLHPGGLVV